MSVSAPPSGRRELHKPLSPEAADSTRLRLAFLSGLVVVLFMLLFTRLWFLQVMAGERFTALAQGNAVRTAPVEAPRGALLDRHGRTLATTRTALVVSVQPQEFGPHRRRVLTELAQLLRLPRREIVGRIGSARVRPFQPKPIFVDAPRDIVFYLHENGGSRFPGVYAEMRPVRDYPHGATAAHVLGTVGEISPERLATRAYRAYDPGDVVGWSGLEQSYEGALSGRKGLRRFEVDARGRVVTELASTRPTPGADVVTTLDLPVQRVAEEALRDGLVRARRLADSTRGGTFPAPAGAVVVLDPRNGEIVALASAPTFKPERFVGGVRAGYWGMLSHPRNDYPLLNRATQSAYPPGSVFKVVTASAALTGGYMTHTSRLPCPGSWNLGSQVFNNWNSAHSGMLDITGALVQSCDTVFYELGYRMWLDEQARARQGRPARGLFTSQAHRWGFGRPTGVDLPDERAGTIPGRAWKQAYWRAHRRDYCKGARTAPPGTYAQRLYAELCTTGNVWRGGDAVNMSIGQGDVQTTPLQVANAFGAIGNGGTLHRPHLVRALRPAADQPRRVRPLGRLPISPADLRVIRRGLEGVTTPGGTAGSVFGDFPVKVAGKTGTAELKPKAPFAWFAAYAPAERPRYAVAVMVEQGGGGSQTAAPIARRVFEGLFDLSVTPLDPGAATD